MTSYRTKNYQSPHTREYMKNLTPGSFKKDIASICKMQLNESSKPVATEERRSWEQGEKVVLILMMPRRKLHSRWSSKDRPPSWIRWTKIPNAKPLVYYFNPRDFDKKLNAWHELNRRTKQWAKFTDMMKLKQKQLHGGGLGELGGDLGPESWECTWWKMVRSEMRPTRITAGYSVRGHECRTTLRRWSNMKTRRLYSRKLRSGTDREVGPYLRLEKSTAQKIMKRIMSNVAKC